MHKYSKLNLNILLRSGAALDSGTLVSVL